MPSTQVAPFRQGLEWHSSVSARNEGLPLGLWAGNPTKRRTRFLACLGRTRCSGGTWEVSGSYLEAYCHCCCWRDEGKRPDHPTRRTLFWCHLMAERRSGDIKTASARRISDTALSLFDSYGDFSLSTISARGMEHANMWLSPPAVCISGRMWASQEWEKRPEIDVYLPAGIPGASVPY